jgi:PTH1 family peptidyl-tRNA hydrolase
LKSIESCLGTREFARLRIGIRGERYSRERARRYVLDRFARSERDAVEATLDRAVEAVRTWIVSGVDSAMNRFNALSE